MTLFFAFLVVAGAVVFCAGIVLDYFIGDED